MFSFRPNLFNHEIGIDIGTVNTVIYVKSKGVVINEPSVIAVRNLGRKSLEEVQQKLVGLGLSLRHSED